MVEGDEKRNKLFRKAIEENRNQILISLENTPDVINNLHERKVLTTEELNKLKYIPSLWTQKQKLINRILQKDFDVLKHLVEVLGSTNNKSLESLLLFYMQEILKECPTVPENEHTETDGFRYRLLKETQKKIIFNDSDYGDDNERKPSIYKNLRQTVADQFVKVNFIRRIIRKEPMQTEESSCSCLFRLVFQAALGGLFDPMIKLLESVNYDQDKLKPCQEKCLKKTQGQGLLHAIVSAKRSSSEILEYMEVLLQKLNGDSDATHNAITGGETKTKLLNQKDNFGQTPLHLAAEKKREIVVETLYHKYNYDILIKDNCGQTILDLINKYMPKIAWRILNTKTLPTVKNSEKGLTGNVTLDVDFGLIIGYPLGDQRNKTCDKYTEMLTLMKLVLGNKKSSNFLLTHVMVITFLYLKWKKMRAYLYSFMIAKVVIYLWYSWFVIKVFLADCPITGQTLYSEMNDENDENDHRQGQTVVNYLFSGWQLVLRALIGLYEHDDSLSSDEFKTCNFNLNWQPILSLAIGCFLLLSEVCKAILLKRGQNKKKRFLSAYCKSWENWFQIMASLLMIFVGSIAFQSTVPKYYYSYAALSIVVVWALIFMQLGYLLGQSIYVLIIGKITKRFVALMLNYLSWIIAFSIALSILFPRETAFETLPKSFMRVITMMTGELNYEETFYGYYENGNGTGIVEGPVASILFSAHIIYMCVALLLTIVLTNALIGLAVSDVQELREKSQVLLRSIKVSKLYIMEAALIQFWRICPFLKNNNIFVIQPNKIWNENGEPTMQGMVLEITSLRNLGVSKKLRNKIKEFAMDRKVYKSNNNQEEENESVTTTTNVHDIDNLIAKIRTLIVNSKDLNDDYDIKKNKDKDNNTYDYDNDVYDKGND